MTRHGHDRAGPVAHQNVVGDPDGHQRAADRVNAVQTQGHPGFVLVVSLTLSLRAICCRFAVGLHFGIVGPLHEWVFGGDDQERCPKERVGPSGKHLERLVGVPIHIEADGCTFGPPDPFSLLNLGRVGPIEGVKVVGQTVGKRGDAEHPLLQWLANHGMATAFRLAINDFFVGQCRAEGGAPIHHLLGEVGQALVVHNLPLRGPVEGLPVNPSGKGFRSTYRFPIGRQIAGRQCVFEHVDRSGFAGSRITKAFVRLQPDPLRPPVIIGIDGGHFA